MNRLHPMYIMDLNDQNQTYKCNIIHHPSSRSIVIPGDEAQDDQNDKWVLNNCALYHKSNIQLPLKIHQDIITKHYDEEDQIQNKYGIIFKNGGEFIHISNYISMIVINQIEFNKQSEDDIIAIDYPLPSIDSMDGNDQSMSTVNTDYLNVCSELLLRNDHELISISGWDTDLCHTLDLNADTLSWTQLPSLQVSRSWIATTMIGEDKLMVIGGYRKGIDTYQYAAVDTVEMFDFDKNAWEYLKPMKHALYQAACCYDDASNNVYVGGGMGAEDYGGICYYDVNKNQWYYDLPETVFHHRNYPLIWIQDVNCLYLSSCIGAKVRTELIDLRMNNGKKSWMKLDYPEVDKLFGIANTSCRVIA